MKGKKCIKLVILCITCLLSLSLYSNVNAASQVWTGNWSIWDEGSSQWINSPSGSFLSISSGFTSTLLRYMKQNYGDIAAGKTITTSATFIVLYDYYQGAINSPAEINCPVIRNTATTISCDIDVSFDVSGGQHFAVYSWTNVSYVTQDITTTSLNYNFYFKNNNNGAIRLYSTGLNFSIGDSELALNTQAIQSFNRDVSSYIGSVVSAINANGNDLESAITSFNSDFNTYRTNTYNQLNSIDSNVSNIWEYLQEKQDQEQEDRDNIEEQSNTTDQEADSSGDEATQTGTSLFGAFTQLLSALTNVNATSCTLPAMQVYSLNLGNMNLCQYDIPPQIMALVSIGMVFIIIPLGINLVKKMISLYKEITG